MVARVAQWIGTRERQEDAYMIRHFPGGTLAVVCDGMGGHLYGDIAARTAAVAFVHSFSRQKDCPLSSRLQNALYDSNDAVRHELGKRAAYGGTTLLAAFCGSGVLWWVSVGDSPLFVWRRKTLNRLNEDHSMRSVYDDLIRNGVTTLRDARVHANMLRSAVTGAPLTLVDAPPTPYPLLPGDRIILGSDGMDDLLLERPLKHSVVSLLEDREGNLAAAIVEACRTLGDGISDNTTVVSLDV